MSDVYDEQHDDNHLVDKVPSFEDDSPHEYNKYITNKKNDKFTQPNIMIGNNYEYKDSE